MRGEKNAVEPLITIKDLKVSFFLDEGTVNAVNGVDLTIPRGKTISLVGESGCGKSVTAFSILRLIQPPGRIVGGRITLNKDGHSRRITDMADNSREIRSIRGKEIAMVFQEPMTSLSPVYTIGNQIMEAVLLHTGMSKKQAEAHTVQMLKRVGFPNAEDRIKQYPHEMSGGLRQRAMIAMALSCRPALLIADEPTTALDVTIQAQILELMRELQAELNMSVLLITHNLGVVAEMAERVAVMYLGRIVEEADLKPIFAKPLHPYTRALLESIPGRTNDRKTALKVIRGSVPDPFTTVPGCPFHPRCDEAEKGLCNLGAPPPLIDLEPGHSTACWVRQREYGKLPQGVKI
jgi:oligopeptide/dipeptide ABC transporter ATP-binding protein